MQFLYVSFRGFRAAVGWLGRRGVGFLNHRTEVGVRKALLGGKTFVTFVDFLFLSMGLEGILTHCQLTWWDSWHVPPKKVRIALFSLSRAVYLTPVRSQTWSHQKKSRRKYSALGARVQSLVHVRQGEAFLCRPQNGLLCILAQTTKVSQTKCAHPWSKNSGFAM